MIHLSKTVPFLILVPWAALSRMVLDIWKYFRPWMEELHNSNFISKENWGNQMRKKDIYVCSHCSSFGRWQCTLCVTFCFQEHGVAKKAHWNGHCLSCVAAGHLCQIVQFPSCIIFYVFPATQCSDICSV